MTDEANVANRGGTNESWLRAGPITLRLGVSIGLVTFVLWRAGLGEIAAIIGRISLAGGALVVLLHTGDRLLMSYKWHRLLRTRGVEVGLGEAIRAYYVSSFASIFLPMTVGADMVRITVMRSSRANSETVIASIALERALGALSQSVFCAFSVLLIFALQMQLPVKYSTLVIAATGAVLVLSLSIPLSFRIAANVQQRLNQRPGLAGRLGTFAGEYAGWRDHPREIWIFLLLTLLEGLFPIVTYLAAAAALDISTIPMEMAAIVPVVYLIARLPISVAGIGVEQGGFAYAATWLGLIAHAPAAAISFFVSPIALLIALLPGLAAWVRARHTPPDAPC